MATARIDLADVERSRTDPGVFAELLVHQPLWEHQRRVAMSCARIRTICSGRQAGKSRTLAILALWEAFRAANRRILILSAGEDAAKDLLAMCAQLASAPLLKGAVVDETKSVLTLSNSSTIRCVPASIRRIRGQSNDLLILDEACFMPEELWSAALPTVFARPDARVLMASTPFGRPDRFFAVSFRAGERREHGFESFHWPSTVSPLIDDEILNLWRKTTTARDYEREVLAKFVDDQSAYFTTDELEIGVDDLPMIRPEDADRLVAVGGIDWGFAADASALTVITTTGNGPNTEHRVSWLEEAFRTPYATFVQRVAEIAKGYRFRKLHSEQNGVGAMPTQELALRLGSRIVVGVHTTAALKQDGFGRVKTLLQEGRFRLPRHPALLQQLAALEFEERDSGTMHISVPERAGHDDLAMSLCLGAMVLPVARRRVLSGHSAADFRIGGGSPLRARDGSEMELFAGSPQWQSWREMTGGRDL